MFCISAYVEVYSLSSHTETVKVEYDKNIIPLCFILDLFYESINPVSANLQGDDYRIQDCIGIYYVNQM